MNMTVRKAQVLSWQSEKYQYCQCIHQHWSISPTDTCTPTPPHINAPTHPHPHCDTHHTHPQYDTQQMKKCRQQQALLLVPCFAAPPPPPSPMFSMTETPVKAVWKRCVLRLDLKDVRDVENWVCIGFYATHKAPDIGKTLRWCFSS